MKVKKLLVVNFFIILLYLILNINIVKATDNNENNEMAEDKIMMYDAETGETTEVTFDKGELNTFNKPRTANGGVISIEPGYKKISYLWQIVY